MGIRERQEESVRARDAYLRKTEVVLKENGFIPTTSYDIKTQTYAGLFGRNPIYSVFFRAYVDTNSKMLAFVNTEIEQVSQLDYTKIIDYNLAIIKKKSESTSGGFAYNIGNGLAVGTSTAEIIDCYTKISFVLTLTDIDNPSFEIVIYNSKKVPLSSTSQYYADIMSFVEVFKPVLDNIIQSNHQEKMSAISTGSNYAEELKACKELLDTGIITQEEFDAKKKQLLNL